MMLHRFVLIGFVGLAGCSFTIPDFRTGGPVTAPVAAAPVAPVVAAPLSAKERFVATTAANGCELNSTNSSVIMAGATVSVEDLARIMTELRAEGRGEIAADGTSFRLTTGLCA